MNNLGKVILATMIMATTQVAAARSWTCHATIHLEGSNATYTVPAWGMSGGFLADRQKGCYEHIQAHFLNTSTLVKLGFNTPDSQIAACKAGGVLVRVDYGLDERNKSWNFRPVIIPSCKTQCSVSGFN